MWRHKTFLRENMNATFSKKFAFKQIARWQPISRYRASNIIFFEKKTPKKASSTAIPAM